ncbi:MAG: efflux RND transporter periplasmic adaptor subunit [Celeribacter marinus]
MHALKYMACGSVVLVLSVGQGAHAQSAPIDYSATDYANVGLDATGTDIRGIVECRDDLELSFAVSGVITETAVVEGQVVAAGDTLMRLDQQIEKIEVDRRRIQWEGTSDIEAANARVEVGEQQLAAGQRVYDAARGISFEELQNRQLAYDLAVTELARLQTQKQIEELDYQTAQESLKRRTLVASTVGIISEVIRRTGESAQANDPVLQLCDISALFFVANLPVKRAELIAQGQMVTLHNTGRDADFSGEVSFVSPVVDPASGLRRIKVRVIDAPEWLSPGTSAALTVNPQ